jgi:hypothetical protein
MSSEHRDSHRPKAWPLRTAVLAAFADARITKVDAKTRDAAQGTFLRQSRTLQNKLRQLEDIIEAAIDD